MVNTKLFETQAKLDKHIAKQQGLDETDTSLFDARSLTCLVVLAEQTKVTQPFKFDEQNRQVDRTIESEKLIEVLQFLLSLGNSSSISLDDNFIDDCVKNNIQLESLPKQYISLFNLISNVNLFDDESFKLNFYKHAFSLYVGLTGMLGYGWGFIKTQYFENVEKQLKPKEEVTSK